MVLAVILVFGANQSIGVTVPTFLTRDLGGTSAEVGLVGALGTAGALIGRFFAPMLATRFQMGLVLVAAGLLGVGLCALYLLTGSVQTVALVRLLHLCVFAVATTTAVIAAVNLLPGGRRATALASVGMAMPLSALVFPWLAADLLRAELKAVALVGVALLSVAVVLFVASFGRPGPVREPLLAVESPSVRAVPASHVVLLGAAAIGASDAVAVDLLPVLSFERGIDNYGWFYTAFALAMIATLTILGRVAWHDRAKSVARLGLAITATAVALLAVASTLPVLMVSALLHGCGFAAAQTALSLWFASNVGLAQRSGRLGRVYLAFDVGRGVGVLAAGWAATLLGFATVLSLLAGYCSACALAMVRPPVARLPAPLR